MLSTTFFRGVNHPSQCLSAVHSSYKQLSYNINKSSFLSMMTSQPTTCPHESFDGVFNKFDRLPEDVAFTSIQSTPHMLSPPHTF